MLDTPFFISKNISIVVQGAVNLSTINEVANNCQHWRDIFPESEIILSISTTDFLTFTEGEHPDPLIKDISSPENPYKEVASSINLIRKACDFIVYNENSVATPLPPIKNDTNSPNNINYMIESSHNGLKFAHKKYTLRIRNDAIFLNDNFISLYCEDAFLSRKPQTSFFKQRVLVPWIYTLNPYAEERFPLHVSDWLNFGLTEDIKKIWNASFYTLSDALFYKIYSHKNANTQERSFITRLATEQYIIYETVKERYNGLEIGYVNDTKSLDLAMNIIIDNFYIFSKRGFSFIINKDYQNDMKNPYKRSTCITEDAWKFQTLNRHIPFKEIFTGNVDENISRLSQNSFPIEKQELPYSKFHDPMNPLKKIIFLFYLKILSNNLKRKFILDPKRFFSDSKSLFTRLIGYLYFIT